MASAQRSRKDPRSVKRNACDDGNRERSSDDVFFLFLISSSARAQETHRLRFRPIQGGGDLAATTEATALSGGVNGRLQRGGGRGRRCGKKVGFLLLESV